MSSSARPTKSTSWTPTRCWRGDRCSTSTRAYLAALRANDPSAVLDVLHDGAASAIRDYVADTGTLVELTGKDAHRAWYESFFARYEIRSVQPLYQVTEDWYVFAELRITVAPRGTNRTVAFHTAEFHVPAKDGRFIARVGHGTEPA